ncbi:discoidin domain-containing protein [Nonomuraea sp. NPDC050783]|uniref:galactose-binding domain-containing protein n=1 Tax=Nonomuraea sp. NPDC050783 TaxID=3154634 RepID=UPI00346577EE
MEFHPQTRSRSRANRFTAGLIGVAIAASMSPAFIASPALAGPTASAAAADGPITIDNSTGLTPDGKGLGPGLDNTAVDGYYYSIGQAQLDSSAGGNNMYLYRGKSWIDKERVTKVFGPETPYVHPDGTRSYPFANANLERIDFERSKTGKYVIWAHWELFRGYGASQTVVLQADRPEGPYTVVTDHARPGASLNVGPQGQPGTTDFTDAMGERVGQLRPDWDTKNAAGTYDGSPEIPVNGRDYPSQVQSFETPRGPRGGGYDPDKPGRVGGGSYGTSQVGNWWTYQFNDLRTDMTLTAVAVRMTPYDQTAYDAAKAQGVNPSAESYIVRYPAAKSDPTKAAGISAQGYGGSNGAYDPNPNDATVPIVDEMAKSTVAKESYHAVKDDSQARQTLKTPLISPRVDENRGVNAGNQSVVVNERDNVYVTADIDLNKYKVLVTTDGSDPRTSGTAFQWENRWDVPNVPIRDGMVVKAVSANSDRTQFSDVATTTFKVAQPGSQESKDVPVFEPVMTFKSGDWKVPAEGGMFGYAELRILSPTYNAEVYYAMDGGSPVPPRYGQNIGFGSRDYAIYTDDPAMGGDGKQYLITGTDHIYMRVWELNADLTGVVPDKAYDINIAKHREAPQAIRGPGGKYVYLLTSGQSGWFKNQAMYQRIANISEGFTRPRDKHGFRNGQDAWTPLQPFADNTTYNSQVGGVWNLGTKDQPVYLFNGSRWLVNDLEHSTTIWLPLTIDDDAMGPGGDTGKTVTVGTGKDGPVTSPTYKPYPGRVSVKWMQQVNVDLTAGTVGPANVYDEQIPIATDPANLGNTDPDNHTPRVIDFQPIGDFYTCDQIDPQGVKDWTTCPGGPLEQQGIVRRYDVGQAFNGIDWDLDNYDGTDQSYRGVNGKFFITLDLGQPRDLTTIGLSFRAVGGSDAAHRYTISGSNDNQNWTTIVNNNQNDFPGFQSHDLTGRTYRYLKYQNNDVWDVIHNWRADWARGMYEMTIRAEKLIPLNVTTLKQAAGQATILAAMTDTFTAKSLANLREKLAPAQALLDALRREGQATQHTQQEVDQAVNALTRAMRQLVGIEAQVTVDFTKLAQAIDQGEARLLESSKYTAPSVEALRKAVNAGRKALAAVDDPDMTQKKIDNRTAKVNEAILGLQPQPQNEAAVDASTLKDVVTKAPTVKDDYTATSWAPFAKVLETAKTVLAAPKSQEQVEAALDALAAAADDLDKKE